MNISNIVKNNLYQIFAIIEKNIRIHFRYKYSLFFSIVLNPLIAILMPLIVLGQFFEYNAQFGPWSKNNFMVYIFVAFNIYLLYGLIASFQSQFSMEKFWKTLPALIIAPFNRFNLLLGIFFSHLTLIFIPFLLFFIICYIYYPISFLSILFIIFLYLLIALIFSGIGLILGIFVISNENIAQVLSFILNLVIFTSCLSYPYEVFPSFIQSMINLNPLYYAFTILRLAWIEDNFLTTISLHFLHFIILLIVSILLPTIAIFVFNKIYRIYGIRGY